MKYLALVILCAWAMTACHDGCDPESSKCEDDAVWICNAEEDWELSIDCAEVEPVEFDWICCVDPEDGLEACLPSDECQVDAGEGEEQ